MEKRPRSRRQTPENTQPEDTADQKEQKNPILNEFHVLKAAIEENTPLSKEDVQKYRRELLKILDRGRNEVDPEDLNDAYQEAKLTLRKCSPEVDDGKAI